MALTAKYHDPVMEIGADGFQAFTKLPAATANKLLENDMYLLNKPSASTFMKGDNGSAAISSTSITIVAISADFTKTIMLQGTQAKVEFGATMASSNWCRLYLYVDGTQYSGAQLAYVGGAQWVSFSLVVSGLTPGSHTFELRWANDAAGYTMSIIRNRVPTFFVVYEI